MSRVFTSLMLSAAALTTFVVPSLASADETDVMACAVVVDYTLGGVNRLHYEKEFAVSIDAPFFDDFSTATRFRFFDATMDFEAGRPVVSITFDSDVSVFNAVVFRASLKVHDETHGETTTGESSFFGGAGVGSNRTFYTLTCRRAN